jgi:hypothetical protein
MVLEKMFKDFWRRCLNKAIFRGFSLPVRKIFGISEPHEQILKRPTQSKFLQKISFLGVIVSEKIFKELLTRTHTSCHDIRSE